MTLLMRLGRNLAETFGGSTREVNGLCSVPYEPEHCRTDDQQRLDLVAYRLNILIDAGRVRFYPQTKVSVIGAPETGWVRETIKGRVHLRKDGRTVETFANDERRDWHCADHGFKAAA
jgi:hypothetical protein